MTYYTTRGDVRGDCGHRHRTMGAAAQCLTRDSDGCARHGGYSDRQIVEIGDDGRETDAVILVDEDGCPYVDDDAYGR